MRFTASLSLLLAVAGLPGPATAVDRISEAREAAGTRWADRVDRRCGVGPQREMRDPSEGATSPITLPEVPNWPEPAAKVFDNVYFVGSKGVSAFAIVTDAGVIVRGQRKNVR